MNRNVRSFRAASRTPSNPRDLGVNAFLDGRDAHTGTDYSHRRNGIVGREEQLAGRFAIDKEDDCKFRFFETRYPDALFLEPAGITRATRRYGYERLTTR